MSEWVYERLSQDTWEVRGGFGDLPERRRHYRLSDGEQDFYAVCDFAYTFDRGPETMLFLSDSNGMVTDWTDILAAPGDEVTDDSMIKEYATILNSR